MCAGAQEPKNMMAMGDADAANNETGKDGDVTGMGGDTPVEGDHASSDQNREKKRPLYDRTFKVMLRNHPSLAISFVNEVFGTSYPQDAPVELLNTEHINMRGVTYSDATIKIAGDVFHLEAQSTDGSCMDRRMTQYDFTIALESVGTGQLKQEGLNYPKSCLVYLRRHGPIRTSGFDVRFGLHDESARYEYKVLNAQEYGMDDIFQKQLFLLFPFYLMRYDEVIIAEIASIASRSEDLKEECEMIRKRLYDETYAKGEVELYHDLVSYAIRVSDKLLAGHEELKQKVRKAMGDDYVETFSEEMARYHREIASKDSEIEWSHSEIERLKRACAEKDEALAEKDKELTEKDATIAELRNGHKD